jgi:hypothetical protein
MMGGGEINNAGVVSCAVEERTSEVVVEEVRKTHHAHTSIEEHVHVGDVPIQRMQP